MYKRQQDNCAHSGVPNTQHAWFSLSDSCLDTTLSPDIQPEAQKCAKEQSVLALDAFVVAYKAAALKPSSFKMYKEDNEPLGMYFPPRGGGCAVSYTHLRAPEPLLDTCCRLLL